MSRLSVPKPTLYQPVTIRGTITGLRDDYGSIRVTLDNGTDLYLDYDQTEEGKR